MPEDTGRDDSGGGRRGKKGKEEAKDMASDPRFYVRFFSNLVQVVAGGLGGRVANQPWMSRGLDAVESLIGTHAAGLVTAGAAALIQNPKLVRTGLKSLGVPEEYVNLLDEAIDSFIHGLGHAQRTKGKITEQDLSKATAEAKEKARSLLLESATFSSALLSLEVARQKTFQAKHADLSEDDKKAFEAYRAKIVGNRWELFNLLLTLIDLHKDSWIAHLKLAYGDVKPPEAGGIMGTLEKAKKKFFGAFGKKAEELVDKPDEALKEMAKGVDGLTDAVDGVRSKIAARRAEARRKW